MCRALTRILSLSDLVEGEISPDAKTDYFPEIEGQAIDHAEESIGHHWMAGHGHVAGMLRAWAEIVGESLRLVGP